MIATINKHQNPDAGLLIVYERVIERQTSGRRFGPAGHWMRRTLEITPYKSKFLWELYRVPGSSPARVNLNYPNGRGTDNGPR